eukprot:CAMPEP_0184521506 /NCGR_PEP_ID=MMETSP0198_2-20121128/7739_1 /TAXON_ID=1112570 /ORGANISM="Thraustochytrium sp., Strain LLF1b" /LENGTH=629 /DNA_ID=CAMNT_0026912179 /DNA_START=56 /DNA_END=1942 /DNA_ORIENTATION=+
MSPATVDGVVGQWSGSSEELGLSRTFTGHNSPIRSVAYMPGMKQAMSGAQDGSIMIWNFKPPQQRAYRLRGHTGAVLSLDAANNQELFASGSEDHTVRLWKPSVRGPFKSFKAHMGPVCSVKFSEDSKLLVTSATDKMVKLWDVSTLGLPRPKFLWCAHGHKNWVRSVDISKWSLNVCSGSDDKFVKVWDTKSGTNVAAFQGHTGNVHSARFDPLTGVCVASGGEDGAINLWDVRSQNAVQHYALQDRSTIKCVRFHPSGNYLLSGSEDSIVRVWDLREGRLLFAINGHSKSVNSLEVASDGSHFVTGSADQLVLAWRCGLFINDDKGAGQEETPETQLRDSMVPTKQLSPIQEADSPIPIRKRSHSKRSKKHRSSSRSGHERRKSHHRSRSSSGDRTKQGEKESENKDQARHGNERKHSRQRSSSGEKEKKRGQHHKHKHSHHGHRINNQADHELDHSHRHKHEREHARENISLTRPLEQTGSPTLARRSSGNKTRTRHSTVGELRRMHERQVDVVAVQEVTASESREPVTENEQQLERNEAISTGPLGEFARAAKLASHRRKSNEEESSNNLPVPPRPSQQTSRVDASHVQSLARAMQNLEARLRMNEDALSDLKQENRDQALPNCG